MDIKAYIDYFPEISQLPRHQQFSVLEKAQARSFSPRTVQVLNLCAWLLPALAILAIGAVIYALFGYSGWLPISAIILGLIIANQVLKRQREHLLKKGLYSILAEQGAPPTTHHPSAPAANCSNEDKSA